MRPVILVLCLCCGCTTQPKIVAWTHCPDYWCNKIEQDSSSMVCGLVWIEMRAKDEGARSIAREVLAAHWKLVDALEESRRAKEARP